MPVDAALSELAKPIEGGQPWPRPACPKCQTGYIGFSSPVEDEDHDSAEVRDHPAFDPEWISGTFVVRGQCENPKCRQAVHGTGDYSVDYSQKTNQDDFEFTGPSYSPYYTVTHLHPPMLIMPIPVSAPSEVREGVLRASRVMFADPGLAATALRATVECFLTAEGIPVTHSTGKFRKAHERIEEWRRADPGRPSVADLFFAVKWLGNAGTHEDSDLTTMEVLDGARVLDEAFHRLFTGPDIEAHARSINAARGPKR
ncbi:DUF4145 domain-containing protein [Paenarthrobacter sp. RAF54_2]|uniref:DUF4145 domain-containing protein n=1 Tax=Paenarthrobacter sp. RAF54_2 TaxID=3233061 RepID=UPI003F952304